MGKRGNPPHGCAARVGKTCAGRGTPPADGRDGHLRVHVEWRQRPSGADPISQQENVSGTTDPFRGAAVPNTPLVQGKGSRARPRRHLWTHFPEHATSSKGSLSPLSCSHLHASWRSSMREKREFHYTVKHGLPLRSCRPTCNQHAARLKSWPIHQVRASPSIHTPTLQRPTHNERWLPAKRRRSVGPSDCKKRQSESWIMPGHYCVPWLMSWAISGGTRGFARRAGGGRGQRQRRRRGGRQRSAAPPPRLSTRGPCRCCSRAPWCARGRVWVGGSSVQGGVGGVGGEL